MCSKDFLFLLLPAWEMGVSGRMAGVRELGDVFYNNVLTWRIRPTLGSYLHAPGGS